MSKILWNSLLVSPAVLGAALVVSALALAAETQADLSKTPEAQPVAEAFATDRAVPYLSPVQAQANVPAQTQTDLNKTAEVQPVKEGVATERPVAFLSPEQSQGNVFGQNKAELSKTSEAQPVAEAVGSDQPVPVLSQLAQVNTNSNQPVAAPPNPASSVPTSAESNFLQQLNRYSSEGVGNKNAIDQVTSVSQLSDVQPTDWAFQALESLVQRYGCIAGYPDGTFRGNRALTRYEFAAGLNACLEQIQALIQAGGGEVTQEDLDTLQKLIDEFSAELATLRGRVDALEVRVAELEANQFSTTTKLFGESIFALATATGGNSISGDVESGTAFGTRTRLNFDTSFTGKDLLRTRLQVANLDSLSTNNTFTPEGDLKFDAGGPYATGDTTVRLDSLLYRTSIGPAQVVFIANAGAADDFANTINPLDGDGGSGALSRFGTRAPIYNMVQGAGVGLTTNLGPAEVSLGYLAGGPTFNNSAARPIQRNGLFDGPYGALAQVVLKPGPLKLGFTYVNSYRNDLLTGSQLATPVVSIAPDEGLTTISNSYGVEVGAEFGNIAFGGWAGYTNARILDTGIKGDIGIWNWAVTLGLNAGPPGSQLGVVVGMEPRVTRSFENSALAEAFDDPDTSIHIEGFYQYQLTENIAITPGFIWLTAPDHNKANDDVVIGTIRTTFTF